MQFKLNAKGFQKSERVRVTAIDAREGTVMVLKNGGGEVPLPLTQGERFQVYRLTELKVSPGDRLRVTENGFDKDGSYRLNNGAFVTVKGFTPDGDIKTANEKVIPRHFGHLNHGYVVTADAAQSKTVNTVYAAIGRESLAATDLRRVYVTISRARDDVRIFTDDREGLLKAAQRDTERRSATELVGKERSRSILKEIPRREAQRQIEVARADSGCGTTASSSGTPARNGDEPWLKDSNCKAVHLPSGHGRQPCRRLCVRPLPNRLSRPASAKRLRHALP